MESTDSTQIRTANVGKGKHACRSTLICTVDLFEAFSVKDFEVAHIPPPSTPRAAGHNPEATTAADPLEEPPEILLISYGFLVALQQS